jgi:hypothetical protein
MNMNPKKPKVQDNCKKGTLSNQPPLTRVTPTALLGSCEQNPIEDMTSLGTDVEMLAYRQRSIEEPTAKDFLGRNAHTIALSKARGTHWNTIKCKECLESHPEAVIRQATINLDSPVRKSLEDSLPKLYCVDLAEAYVMQESASSRILCEKKRYVLHVPKGHSHEKPPPKSGMGKENRY